jgi:hypothetical protein
MCRQMQEHFLKRLVDSHLIPVSWRTVQTNLAVPKYTSVSFQVGTKRGWFREMAAPSRAGGGMGGSYSTWSGIP